MRRKLFGFVMAFAMMLSLCTVAFADSTVTEEDIKALPKPGDDVKLIEALDVSGDAESGYSFISDSSGNVTLHSILEDGYKIIIYQPESNMYWVNTVIVETQEGSPGDKPIEIKYADFTQASDFLTAVQDAYPVEENYEFQIITGNTYIIYLKADADSLDDVVYACKTDELLNHVYDFYADKPKYAGQTATVSVDLVNKLYSGSKVVGAKFKFNYDLPGYNKNGYLFEEYASLVMAEDVQLGVKCPENSTSGSVEFTIDAIRNTTYDAYIVTDVGNEYHTSFTVDFASADNRDAMNLSMEKPVVTFVGLPDDSVRDMREVLHLTAQTNVPVTLMWNGNAANNGLSTSISLDIAENGIYYYTATTEAGKIDTGYIEIHCFDSNWVMPENSELVVSSNGLVQTGYEVESSLSYTLIIVLAVSVCLIIAGVACVKRKGEKKV